MLNFTHYEQLKYSRQITLPEIGESGQLKLKNASVLCVGAGGLGSSALYYLASAGVGKIGIIDFDKIMPENLQRQILYAEADCGKYKADIAYQRLSHLNSQIQIEKYTKNFDLDNAKTLVDQYDIVLDGSDNYPTRYLVNDACFFACKPLISASVFQFHGQLSVFNLQEGPCYRCLYPMAPQENLIPNCAESGILGATTGILGSMMAVEAIKLIIGLTPIYSGVLVELNILDFSITKLGFKKAKNCILCAGKVKSLLDLEEQYMQTESGCVLKHEVDAILLQQLLADTNKKILLVDVRTFQEFQAFNIPGSIHIPLDEIEHIIDVEEKIKPDITVLYCQKGIRSEIAIEKLAGLGYFNKISLKGGINSWLQNQ